MSVDVGTRLGSLEIIALIGKGGMGEVYRARDTKLKRDVAIKILPNEFSRDPERVSRFQREAEVLASLNHPNIAAIYDLQKVNDIRYLVLELVEGEDLADRLRRGPIPVKDALDIAKDVCEAMEAAHEKGVIHRDLKPGNIKLTSDGKAKVLDFGLAKAVAGAPSTTMLSNSPTLSAAATNAGGILGTAAYMSPEQANGRAADKRSDIWAFGCVLYEMLTGKRAFRGEDVSDTLASVLEGEPNWSALPSDVPPTILALIRRCLQKDRKRRIPDISTALFLIEEQGSFAGPTTDEKKSPRWLRIAAFAVVAIAASLVAGVTDWFRTRPNPPAVSRLTINTPGSTALTVGVEARDLAISPDGTRIAYIGSNGTQLFVRAIGQLEPTPLTNLGSLRSPFFSPDGQWIGFFNTNSTLSKVSITGGSARTLYQLAGNNGRGATWGPDKTIIFATADSASGLLRVAEDGGTPIVLTKPNREAGEADHVWPEFLPGGRAVLFTITSTTEQIENAQVAVLDLQTNKYKILVGGGSHAHYLPSGHLVYGVSGTLKAIAFDLRKLNTIGAPVPVLSQVVTTATGSADFDVSRDGTLVYVTGGVQSSARSLVWVDRHGHEEPLKSPQRAYLYARISPDGTRIALDIRDQDQDIWMWNIARETLTRMTADPALDRFPIWVQDGQHVIFASDRAGMANLYSQIADGTAMAERLAEIPNFQKPTSLSPDGARLVFESAPLGQPKDLMMLTLDKEHRLEPLVQAPSNDQNGVLSPDGRWLAYDSDETQRFEIYVRPFPDVKSGRWQVSTGGGSQALWSRNGKELFYLNPTVAGERVTLMSVPIGPGKPWNAGVPTKLFEGPYFHGNSTAAATYDVSPDGRRFLFIKSAGTQQATAPSLVVVQNWLEELKRLVPVR